MSKGELTFETGSAVESKGLKGGALGLVSSIVVGMASTAPAYSLAASLGLIVASGGALLAGVKAPAIIAVVVEFAIGRVVDGFCRCGQAQEQET
jgi:hypothetical protein